MDWPWTHFFITGPFRLGELEALEEKIKNETHEGYQTLLEDIQTKRTKKLIVAQGRHAMMASNFKNGFLAQKKSAEDQFYVSGGMGRGQTNHADLFLKSWTNWPCDER
jgi:predicted ATPase